MDGTVSREDDDDRERPGLVFYLSLQRERAARSAAERMEARRRMKALCPGLFAAYLERFGLF